MPIPENPQTLNRYSYVTNNPLKYTDPSGHVLLTGDFEVGSTSTEVQEYWEEVGEGTWDTGVGWGSEKGFAAAWAILEANPDILFKGNAVIDTSIKGYPGGRYFDMHYGTHSGSSYYHFNADVGILKGLNGTELPSWVVDYGSSAAKGLIVTGIVLDTVDIASSVQQDIELGYGAFGPNTKQSVARVGGGWGGAFGGAALGGAIAGPPGALIGGIIGGIGGSWIGSKLGEWF